MISRYFLLSSIRFWQNNFRGKEDWHTQVMSLETKTSGTDLLVETKIRKQ